MSYRIGEPKPHKANRTTQKIITPQTTYLRNGTSIDIAYPCWYFLPRFPIHTHPHNRELCDHYGWPSPNHPDHVCQCWHFKHSCCSLGHRHQCHHGCRDYIDLRKFVPIHLRAEGYTSAGIAFNEKPPTGLTWSASIDQYDDWIVRVFFSAMLETAETAELKFPFTVKVKSGTRTDLVASGNLVIVPGPWQEMTS